MTDWQDFFSGSIFTLFAVIGLFFTKFFVRTRDRFFLYFAVAFMILSLERLVTVGAILTEAQRPLLYLFRVLAFGSIIWAVWQKNREADAEEPYDDHA